MHSFKTNHRDSGIRTLDRGIKIGCPRCDSQDASPRSEVNIVASAGGGVEHLHALDVPRSVEARDLFPRLERSRIPAGSDHHAGRRIRGPTQFFVAHVALYGSFESIDEVAFETH